MTDHTKLKELALAATPGPWINGNDDDSDSCLVGPHRDGIVSRPVVKLSSECDAEYIAAANPAAVLALIAEVEKWKQAAITMGANEAKACIERDALKAVAAKTDDAITWATEQVEQIIAERDALRAQVDQFRELLELNVREHEEKGALIAQLRRGAAMAAEFNDAQRGKV